MQLKGQDCASIYSSFIHSEISGILARKISVKIDWCCQHGRNKEYTLRNCLSNGSVSSLLTLRDRIRDNLKRATSKNKIRKDTAGLFGRGIHGRDLDAENLIPSHRYEQFCSKDDEIAKKSVDFDCPVVALK